MKYGGRHHIRDSAQKSCLEISHVKNENLKRFSFNRVTPKNQVLYTGAVVFANFRLNIVNSSRIALLKYNSRTCPLHHSLASVRSTTVTVASLAPAVELLCGRHSSRC